eukprot:11700-Heterococcus_DN1.PRE.1
MAGHAAKKAAAAESKASAEAALSSIDCLVCCLTSFELGFWRHDLLRRWQIAGFLFTSAVYWVCYKGVVEAAGARSGGAGYYLDLLVLTAATQVLCLFSDKGWYLYML